MGGSRHDAHPERALASAASQRGLRCFAQRTHMPLGARAGRRTACGEVRNDPSRRARAFPKGSRCGRAHQTEQSSPLNYSSPRRISRRGRGQGDPTAQFSNCLLSKYRSPSVNRAQPMLYEAVPMNSDQLSPRTARVRSTMTTPVVNRRIEASQRRSPDDGLVMPQSSRAGKYAARRPRRVSRLLWWPMLKGSMSRPLVREFARCRSAMQCSIRLKAEATRPSTGDLVKISIDSNEPLEGVLRVVGAAYDVTLTVVPAEPTNDETAKSVRPRGLSPRPSQGDRAARNVSTGRAGSSKDRAKVSNAELRSWARENGHTVSDRGRVPAAVVAAYRQAH